MKGLKMKCKALVCLCSSAAPLFPFTCTLGCISSCYPTLLVWQALLWKRVLCLRLIISARCCKTFGPILPSDGTKECYRVQQTLNSQPPSNWRETEASGPAQKAPSIMWGASQSQAALYPWQIIPRSSWHFQLRVLLICVAQHLATKKSFNKK